MEAKELRIGNLVMYDNYNVSIVHGITDSKYGNGIHVHYGNCCVGCAEEMIEPIKLTEEWLIKFGFKREIIGREAYIYKRINSTEKLQLYKGNVIYGIIGVSQYEWSETKIQHVHQLQNLYFALTGEELTLKT